MILIIDNFCSFTYNIVQYFSELQQNVIVKQNDQISLDDIKQLKPDAIVLGPGPCTPNEAGISLPILKHISTTIPTLGVCLGHQAIGQAFGGRVVQADEIMHGRLSSIYHDGLGVFTDLPAPFDATRYHSLVIDKASLPQCLSVTAWTANQDGSIKEIMGVRHQFLPIQGVQFHPESILSEHGYQIFNNFLHQHGLAKLDNQHLPKVA
ncbi:aminodeoxychorismate/anthranilate synthase component II [Moraxella nasovis]|uniref:anthranilate synthase component II n=1 Tax=Moraxella nasovis TaxID=2904121 RepID=UPI001F617950|nr:aminodeoxychorismate/anthranilate synthase component II [Moraxella nasovis]UNU73532.1 aminodeoxychorismate/anthranilate synthase component II [Moraxella nasovis]